MRFKEILREYNEQRLIHDFGNKLIARLRQENFIAPAAPIIIKVISSYDPTPNKELTFWLVLNYANGGIPRFEDIRTRAVPALLKFKALLRKPNLNPPLLIRDINQVKGLSQLEDILEKYSNEIAQSNAEQDKKEEQDLYKTGQAKIIFNNNELKVLEIHSKKAAIFFGRNTRWCTSGTDYNAFHNYYKPNDPLYIIIIKGTNEKYQLHFGSGQLMDAIDQEENPVELGIIYPVLWKIFTPIAEKRQSLIFNEHPSEELQLKYVKQNGFNIKYIKNPTEKVQIAAVEENWIALNYIDHPSEKVKSIAKQSKIDRIKRHFNLGDVLG